MNNFILTFFHAEYLLHGAFFYFYLFNSLILDGGAQGARSCQLLFKKELFLKSIPILCAVESFIHTHSRVGIEAKRPGSSHENT